MNVMSSVSSYGSSPPLDLGRFVSGAASADALDTAVSRSGVAYSSDSAEVKLSPQGLAKASAEAVGFDPKSGTAAKVGDEAEDEQLTPKEQAEKQSEEEENEEELAEAAREEAKALMQSLNKQNIDLSFSVDKDLGNTVVSVMDKATEDVIRQIPSEEFLEMSKRLREYTEANAATPDEKKDALKGLLLDAQV